MTDWTDMPEGFFVGLKRAFDGLYGRKRDAIDEFLDLLYVRRVRFDPGNIRNYMMQYGIAYCQTVGEVETDRMNQAIFNKGQEILDQLDGMDTIDVIVSLDKKYVTHTAVADAKYDMMYGMPEVKRR